MVRMKMMMSLAVSYDDDVMMVWWGEMVSLAQNKVYVALASAPFDWGIWLTVYVALASPPSFFSVLICSTNHSIASCVRKGREVGWEDVWEGAQKKVVDWFHLQLHRLFGMHHREWRVWVKYMDNQRTCRPSPVLAEQGRMVQVRSRNSFRASSVVIYPKSME